MFRNLLLSIIFTVCAAQFNAQTPGLIYEPATGTGSVVLDPNGDGYVSGTTSGFISNDKAESEIQYVPFIFPGAEPIQDINNAPNCGFTDFVDGGVLDPALKFLDASNNWLFRLRLGGTAPNAKSYSVLIDTDGLFGNTGALADPNYSLNNPGFEIEIVLATKFGVFVYDVNTPNCTPVISYTGTTNYQKAVAISTNCANPDYFYDFFVKFSDLTSTFSITPSTLMRFAIVDNAAANKSTICNPSSASDVAGVGNCTSLAECFTTIVNNQGPCAPNQSNCLARTSCPTLNTPIAVGSTSVSGTSTETVSTIIKVYRNGVLTGTTNLVSGSWTLTGITPPLAAGNVIEVKALASGKDESLSSCNIYSIPTCSAISSPIASITNSTPKGFCGTGVNNSTITIYYQGSTVITSTPNYSWTSPGVFEWKCNGSSGCTAGSAQCLCDGAYYITQTEPGKCESPGIWECVERTGATDATCNPGNIGPTTAPTITTSPITATMTSISGLIAAPDNTAGITVILYANGLPIGTTTTTAGGNWTVSSLNLSARSCNTITAIAIIPFKCASGASNTVIVSGGITSAPLINSNFCVSASTSTVSVTGVSGEANGTVIRIYVNGTLQAQTATVTNGTWTVSPISVTAGSSTITAAAIAPCKSQSAFSNSVAVSVQSAVGSLSITTNPIIEQTTSISGSGSAGTSVQVYIDNFPVGSPVPVVGGVWTLTLQPYDMYTNGVVTAAAISSGGCPSSTVSGGVVICIQPTNTLSINPSTPVNFCSSSGTVAVTVLNSQPLIVYQLYLANGITPTGSSIMGNGSAITLTTGVLTSSTTLKVKAFKLPPNSCESFLTNTVAVNFGSTPTTTLLVNASANPICAGSSASLNISSSQSGYSYQLRNNTGNITVGSAVLGTGGLISLPTGTLSANTSFNILVTGLAPASCTAQLNTITSITVNSTPVVSIASNPTLICSGSLSSLSASGAVSYSWNTGAVTASISVSPSVTTTYTVTGTTSGCSDTKTLSLTVNTAPTVNASASSTAICSGANATLTASGATSYSWNTGATTTTVSVSPLTTTIYTVTGFRY